MGQRDVERAFEAQAARVGAAVRRTSPTAVVATVVEILRDAECRTVALADALPERPLLAAALRTAEVVEVPVSALRPTNRADAGVSLARLGVAETGSALLHSSASDRRVELCVDVHLVLLSTAALVPTLDAAFTTLRDIARRAPAYVSLVSGPSRSADIERQITIGVHGPRALHVLLLEDQS